MTDHRERAQPAPPSGNEAEEVPLRVLAAERRRQFRDMLDHSSLGEHVREVGPDGFACCRCGRWTDGLWEDHLGDEASRDMDRRR